MRSSLLIILCFLSHFFSVSAQEKIYLQFNPQKGLIYITDYVMNTIIDQEIMGIDQQIQMNMLMQTETQVEESSKEKNILSMGYKRLAIETVTPMTSLTIDTDSEDVQPGTEYLQMMTGKKFSIIVNSRGEIVNIEGLEQIITDITNNIREDNPVVQSYKNTLNDAFGEENIKNYFGQTTPVYPDYKVGIGDSWTYDQMAATAQFEFMTENISVIKDIKPEYILIQTNSSIHTPESGTIQIEGIQAKLTMKGNQVGEIIINAESGIPIEGIIKQDIIGELILDMSEQGMQDMKVPMKISTRIEFKSAFE
jgi:hypothetical protein